MNAEVPLWVICSSQKGSDAEESPEVIGVEHVVPSADTNAFSDPSRTPSPSRRVYEVSMSIAI